MPIDSPQSFHVEYTPEFKRSLRKLARKYRSIRTDLEPVIKGLQAGELVGDQITGTGYTLFKSRVRNSDIQKRQEFGLSADLLAKNFERYHSCDRLI